MTEISDYEFENLCSADCLMLMKPSKLIVLQDYFIFHTLVHIGVLEIHQYACFVHSAPFSNIYLMSVTGRF